MTRPRNVLCVLNPLSCDGDSARRRPDVERFFEELEIPREFIEERGDLSAKLVEILEADPTRHSVVAGLGGDGTQHALINGLMRFKADHPDMDPPDYAIIPLGTGNDIAKSFGVSSWEGLLFSELRRAVAATAYGARLNVDLGVIDGRYFLDAFTVGVDAHILAGRNEGKSKISRTSLMGRWLKGYPLYLLCVLKSLRQCKPLHGEIHVDDVLWHQGPLYNIIINNTRIYAGEFDLTDTAFANDERLDILVFTGPNDYVRHYFLGHRQLPRRVRARSKLDQRVKHTQGKRFRISLEKPIPAQMDGEELAPGDAFEIETVPNAVTLRVPVEPS